MARKAVYVSIAECAQIKAGVAVVIDVLRAFSTAAWAFHLGIERIILAAEIDEALRIKSTLPGALAMKDSDPLEGFELSNSPVELQAAGGLAGRTLVHRTGHGTVGAVAAKAAKHLYCASFLTARTTADAVRLMAVGEVFYVISGDDGLAEEDRACAEYIMALIEEPSAEAAPFLRRARESATASLLARRVANGTPGVHKDDVEACMEANRFDFAMRAREEDGLLVLRRV